MARYKLMIAQFPGGNMTVPDVSDYVTNLCVKLGKDDRFNNPGDVYLWRRADTPITMTRNQACEVALLHNVDFLLMLDNDMWPDYLNGNQGAKPFFETSIEFMLAHEGPCVVAAPYCGPPPYEMVYVFRWQNRESENPNPDFQIEAYDRDTASKLTGIQRAAALPTGLMLIDMRAIKKLRKPYFYYEWKDDGAACEHCGVKMPGAQVEKASTEDVTFSRDLEYVGVPIYCNWDAWAGHWKKKLVGKPQMLGSDVIPLQLRQAAEEQVRAHYAEAIPLTVAPVKTAAHDGVSIHQPVTVRG